MTIRVGLPRSRRGRIASLGVVGTLVLALVAGCGLFGAAADKFEQAFEGLSATMSTYNQYGQPVDEIHGKSFRVTRDEEFDSCNTDGCKADSSVLLISLGDAHIHHVGSTMILAEDGLTDITANLPKEFRFNNDQPGTPWINDIRYRFQQLWGGTSKTIMIRSQDGTPIKVYGGNEVQVLSTEVPKSTWFRIKGADGKNRTLFVYRADYTAVDNKLLQK
ncbi:MAG TPA: DUF5052 family protein [Candidatus Saccharimonadales bacterium]|nr:DUF5052 family protein [Candidatus Saccharimonadales bacterium]